MPISTCTITGNVKNLLNSNISNCKLKVSVISPFFHSGSWISGELASVQTDSNGDFSIDVIETESVGHKVDFTFDYYDGVATRKTKKYTVVVPDQASALLSDLVTIDTGTAGVTTFPASNVTVSTISGLSATTAQGAFAEHQSDIDGLTTSLAGKLSTTLTDGQIFVGNASNVATGVTPSGDVTISNAGVTAIASGVIVNADVNASADIAHSKLANITAGSVLLGNASNVPTATALTGDIGVDSSGVTSIGSGVIVNADVNASAAIAYSKLNLAGSILNADINASAGIVDTKLATISTAGKVSNSATTATNANTASAIVARDASGNFSAGTITANLTGNVTGNVTGDVTGNCSGTALSVTGVTSVAHGGTGLAALTLNSLVAGNGSSSVNLIAPSTAGNVLLSNGTSFASTTISGDATLSGTGDLQLAAGAILNADVNASAAIARSKLASGTNYRILANNSSGVMSENAALTANTVVTADANGQLTGVAPGTSGNVLTSDGTNWTSSTPASAPDQSYEISNLGVAASVASSALTIALKGKNGSDPSGSNVVKIGFRNSTAATGTYNQRSVTAALSVVVSSGSTLGHSSGGTHYIYLYAIDNAGTVELAVSSSFYDDGTVVTTTAEGGAGAADSGATIYSTTARTGVPSRLIGRLKVTEATAGTWATAPSEISLRPFSIQKPAMEAMKNGGSVSAGSTIASWTTVDGDTRNAFNSSTGVYTCPEAGWYQVCLTLGGSSSSANPGIQQNSSVLIYGNASARSHVSLTVKCAAGDTLLGVSTATTTCNSDTNSTRLSIIKIGEIS